MNRTLEKITVGIGVIISVLGILLLGATLFYGTNAFVEGDPEYSEATQTIALTIVVLSVLSLAIAIVYFVGSGISSLLKNPAVMKKDAIPLIVLVIVGVMMAILVGLNIDLIQQDPTYIITEDDVLKDYYNLDVDQIGSVSSWKSWIGFALMFTGVLLLISVVAFVYDIVKSSIT